MRAPRPRGLWAPGKRTELPPTRALPLGNGIAVTGASADGPSRSQSYSPGHAAPPPLSHQPCASSVEGGGKPRLLLARPQEVAAHQRRPQGIHTGSRWLWEVRAKPGVTTDATVLVPLPVSPRGASDVGMQRGAGDRPCHPRQVLSRHARERHRVGRLCPCTGVRGHPSLLDPSGAPWAVGAVWSRCSWAGPHEGLRGAGVPVSGFSPWF